MGRFVTLKNIRLSDKLEWWVQIDLQNGVYRRPLGPNLDRSWIISPRQTIPKGKQGLLFAHIFSPMHFIQKKREKKSSNCVLIEHYTLIGPSQEDGCQTAGISTIFLVKSQ